MMKRLMIYWFRSGLREKFRLSEGQCKLVSDELITLIPFVCSEFKRKPRTLGKLERWKATELRQFLLYTGPVVLRSRLPDDYYNHFMLLHVA